MKNTNKFKNNKDQDLKTNKSKFIRGASSRKTLQELLEGINKKDLLTLKELLEGINKKDLLTLKEWDELIPVGKEVW